MQSEGKYESKKGEVWEECKTIALRDKNSDAIWEQQRKRITNISQKD